MIVPPLFMRLLMSSYEQFDNHLKNIKFKVNDTSDIHRTFDNLFRFGVLSIISISIVCQVACLSIIVILVERYESFFNGFAIEIKNIGNYSIWFFVVLLLFIFHMLVIFIRKKMIGDFSFDVMNSPPHKLRVDFMAERSPELKKILNHRINLHGYFTLLDYKIYNIDKYYELIRNEGGKYE